MPVVCSATCTVLGCQGRRHLRRGADAVSYGPDCSEIHSDSSVAVHEKVVDVTVGRSSRFHVCCLCEDSRDSTVARVYSFLDKVVDMPVVFNDICPC